MAEIDQGKISNGSRHWDWLPAILLRPRKTIAAILEQEKPVWMTPMLVISVLVILAVIISAPIQRVITQNGTSIPENFEYWSEDEQNQFYQSQASQTSPINLYLFPVLQRLAGYWLIWFLFSSILHLVITLAGSRATRQKASNLTAWAMTPFALRLIAEILVMLTTKRLVENPGLSSLIPAAEGGLAVYLQGILSKIDIYYIIHLVLVFMGGVPLSGLNKSKANWSTLIAAVIMLLLEALPALAGSLLSGLSLSGFYF